jgi:hypothetical protein
MELVPPLPLLLDIHNYFSLLTIGPKIIIMKHRCGYMFI